MTEKRCPGTRRFGRGADGACRSPLQGRVHRYRQHSEHSSLNETPVLYYESEDLSISIEIAEIGIQDQEHVTADLTSVLSTLLTEQQAGLNITSVRRAAEEHDPDRTSVDVEFRKRGTVILHRRR